MSDTLTMPFMFDESAPVITSSFRRPEQSKPASQLAVLFHLPDTILRIEQAIGEEDIARNLRSLAEVRVASPDVRESSQFWLENDYQRILESLVQLGRSSADYRKDAQSLADVADDLFSQPSTELLRASRMMSPEARAAVLNAIADRELPLAADYEVRSILFEYVGSASRDVAAAAAICLIGGLEDGRLRLQNWLASQKGLSNREQLDCLVRIA